LPGTTTTSLFLVFLFIVLKLTAIRPLLDLDKYSAMSSQIAACLALLSCFKSLIIWINSGFVVFVSFV
jgi:hypothetical protein